MPLSEPWWLPAGNSTQYEFMGGRYWITSAKWSACPETSVHIHTYDPWLGWVYLLSSRYQQFLRLNWMNDSIQHIERTIDTFRTMACTLHKLPNPLTAIDGILETDSLVCQPFSLCYQFSFDIKWFQERFHISADIVDNVESNLECN